MNLYHTSNRKLLVAQGKAGMLAVIVEFRNVPLVVVVQVAPPLTVNAGAVANSGETPGSSLAGACAVDTNGNSKKDVKRNSSTLLRTRVDGFIKMDFNDNIG